MEEALKKIYEEFFGIYKEFRLAFHADGKGCAIYTNGIFNRDVTWD